MKYDLIAILDTVMDQPNVEPDLAAVKTIAYTTNQPIALMAEVVRLLWLAAEKPEEFDKAVCALYE